MFQLNLLNSHIQHIICLCICPVTQSKSSDLHKLTVHKSSWREIHKIPQKPGSDSYSRYTKCQVCMTIKIQAHRCTYSRLPFYYIPSITQALLPTLKHCTIQKKNNYRKQLHLPLILNCMILIFGEFIKSCKQCFIWARVAEGIPHTAVCTWGQTHTAREWDLWTLLRFGKLLLINFSIDKKTLWKVCSSPYLTSHSIFTS